MQLDVHSVPPHIVPYPECSGTTWGISPATAKKQGVSTKFTSGIIYTKNGQSEVGALTFTYTLQELKLQGIKICDGVVLSRHSQNQWFADDLSVF